MQRFFPTLTDTLRNSVLVRLGLVMSVLAVLSLVSIVISTLIADDISGRANAINVSGSLRFLSYRALSEVQQPAKQAQALETMKTFERRLLGLERFVIAKSNPDSASVIAIRSLVQRWNTEIYRLETNAARGDPAAIQQMSHEIPLFVDQIDQAVRLIEEELEGKERWLRLFQLVLLGTVVLISMMTIWLLHWQLVQPLAGLVEAAKTVAQGSFNARVRHVSQDELGQLGLAFNTMVGEIATMYAHLEEKVEEKTRELKQTNESLELLYRVSQRLSASDLTLDTIQEVLREVEEALDLGHTSICISEGGQFPAHRIASDLSPAEIQALCNPRDCRNCFARDGREHDGDGLLTLPLGDGDRVRGVMSVLQKENLRLQREKLQVLETVGHHVSNALIGMHRAEERHRMAVLEERTVIARELHDSIAQVGGAHLACEYVSNILTKLLQRGRLAAYLEQSTRYIPYDSPMEGGGGYRWQAPAAERGVA